MDINICIDKLGLNANSYKLDQSNPPHSITEWTGTDPQPTEAELTTVWNNYQSEYDNNLFQRQRAQEYPPIVDQLDNIFHNGLDGWKASIQVVKDKYPKG